MKETSVAVYQVNEVTGRRRVIALCPGWGIRPDYQWVRTGVWRAPGPPPTGGSSVHPPLARDVNISREAFVEVLVTTPHLGGPIGNEDVAWLRRALKAQTPVGHCGESSAEMIERQRVEERVARIMSAIAFHVGSAETRA